MTVSEPDRGAVDEMAFDAALAELERAVAELETGGLALERTLALFERAVRSSSGANGSSARRSCACAGSWRVARGRHRGRPPRRRGGLIHAVGRRRLAEASRHRAAARNRLAGFTAPAAERGHSLVILPNIHGPGDIRRLSERDLFLLAEEMRGAIVETVATTGGHLGQLARSRRAHGGAPPPARLARGPHRVGHRSPVLPAQAPDRPAPTVSRPCASWVAWAASRAAARVPTT